MVKTTTSPTKTIKTATSRKLSFIYATDVLKDHQNKTYNSIIRVDKTNDEIIPIEGITNYALYQPATNVKFTKIVENLCSMEFSRIAGKYKISSEDINAIIEFGGYKKKKIDTKKYKLLLNLTDKTIELIRK